ncbi:sce7726 family protein [Vibrio fluvialis]|uniref:sce7726 family protein n=1 Tax=Vibrio fluvialis TaxID=676 RepID=UPI00046251F1|nr:sce7726 family protein [Vibrio fluvialis]MCG6391417.1 sce7726 family protein [Vibrio fluvialis]MCG6418940.1 sce7726 family protein [Vibrio fluvialis]
MKEIEIKKLLVKHILCLNEDVTIGAEVPFNFGSRRADIMSIHNGLATAYEIKGAGDNVDRLSYQIRSYKEYFDYCFIVCEKSNLQQIRRVIGDEIGILVASSNDVTQIRKSKLFKRHDKESLASTLAFTTLKQLVKNKHLRSKHELGKEVGSLYSIEKIRDLARSELNNRYTIVTNLLKQDIDKEINSDDILTITRMPPRELVLRS